MPIDNSKSKLLLFIEDALLYIYQTISVLITAIVIPLAFFLISLPSTSEFLWFTDRTWGIIILAPSTIISLILTILTKKDETVKAANFESMQEAYRLTSEKLKELEGENEKMRADYEDLVNDQLGLIFHKMGLSTTERITVYKHDAENEQFLVLGRYSADPEYSKRSRPFYPDSQGFIMQGWRSDEFISSDLPDPTLKKGKTYYDAVNRISSIPKPVVKQIRMKSRCFYVRRIHNPAGHIPIAVIVIESLGPKTLDTRKMRDWFEEEVSRLISFVQRIGTSSVQANGKLAQLVGL